MKKIVKIGLVLAAIAVFWFAGAELMAQCPMCKAAVESGTEDGNSPLAEGLNIGIIYLFVLPYLAIVTIGVLWFRANRKKKRAAEANNE